MKRILLVLLSLSALSALSGCAKASETVPLVSGIKFFAEYTFNGERYEADVTVNSNQTVRIVTSLPETLKGIEYTVSEKGINTVYNGLEYSTNLTKQPSAELIIFEILHDAGRKTAGCRGKNENPVVNGKAANKDYTLYLGGTGLPLSAETDDGEFSIVFKAVGMIDTAAGQ